jgi:protein SCO1/2
MKTKWIVLSFVVFALLVIGAGAVVARHKFESRSSPADATQRFQVNGIVRGFENGGKTVVIEHEDIPNFMPAMTMPFAVEKTNLLSGIKPGDSVRFELVVTKDDSWIARLMKRGESAVVPQTGVADESCEIGIGQVVPDFTLTNQNAQAFELNKFRGKTVLLTFVYTRCPLPNYCPLMSKNFSELQKILSREFPGKFHLVSISFDPAHDTPEVLKNYANVFSTDDISWSFCTGSQQQVESVASEFGLVYLPESGTFTHDLRTALIAPDGRLIHIWRSNVWTPEEVRSRVAEVLARSDSAMTLTSAKSKSGF